MKLQLVGCSHHGAAIELREKIAFSPDEVREALAQLKVRFPETESVIISTCNRVEIYTAAADPLRAPTFADVVDFLAEFHGLAVADVFDHLHEAVGEDAVKHLFTVAASLDSMVLGEAQISSQVKQAYDLAQQASATGPVLNHAFQFALRVAKRVAAETSIQQKRISIPSVAVADFARQIFERFDDKQVLIIGAGEMAEETVKYLVDEGARKISVVNRSFERGVLLAEKFQGRAEPWDKLHRLLADADLVVSTTGASEPIVTLADFRRIEQMRDQRTLFVLDLAVPRDFDPAIGRDCANVYLYAVDDLRAACDANRRAREEQLPAAEQIVTDEAQRFLGELSHRATGPTIRRLQERHQELKDEELLRFFNKYASLDPKLADDIRRLADRLVNKMLHPPLESLREEAERGAAPQGGGLLDALKRLFQLRD